MVFGFHKIRMLIYQFLFYHPNINISLYKLLMHINIDNILLKFFIY